jgi:ABC-2 type transport system permease protein
VLPLTYGADVLKQSINNTSGIQQWISLLMMIGFGTALFFISTKNIEKRWIY